MTIRGRRRPVADMNRDGRSSVLDQTSGCMGGCGGGDAVASRRSTLPARDAHRYPPISAEAGTSLHGRQSRAPRRSATRFGSARSKKEGQSAVTVSGARVMLRPLLYFATARSSRRRLDSPGARQREPRRWSEDVYVFSPLAFSVSENGCSRGAHARHAVADGCGASNRQAGRVGRGAGFTATRAAPMGLGSVDITDSTRKTGLDLQISTAREK